jgi:hypothetical protein
MQVFVSLMLVVGSIVLFAFSAKQRDHEHGSRLSLLPLEEDAPPRSTTPDPPALSPRGTGNE